ncbi:hypothetical protein DERF_011874 [Dermatophagoides farinae]|uniref:Uncharacterized protein n=1 Tax=Dermatophagoides farinae TaxID=6954 RepID=A0A922KZG3_DERFA|nr:hypothetical protein DERF_011874 [Dermatophagoides farinae]
MIIKHMKTDQISGFIDYHFKIYSRNETKKIFINTDRVDVIEQKILMLLALNMADIYIHDY